MDGRYEVFATHGKGVFSSVLRARDKQNPVPGTEVAIKMIRSNETMYKAAQTEKVCPSCLARFIDVPLLRKASQAEQSCPGPVSFVCLSVGGTGTQICMLHVMRLHRNLLLDL